MSNFSRNNSTAYAAAMHALRGPTRGLLLEHADRVGAAGFYAREVIERNHLDEKQAHALMNASNTMRKKDKVPTLWGVQTGARTTRLFGRQEWAAAYATVVAGRAPAARYTRAYNGEWRAPYRGMKQQLRGRAWWAHDVEPRETPDTVYTFAPPPPARVTRTNTHPIY